MQQTVSWIGKAMARREDARLLKGAGRFVDDHQPEGCLFLEFLRSPYAAGRITDLDVSEAAVAEGVIAVLTAADFAGLGQAAVNALLPGAEVHPLEPLASGRVKAVGQAIAAVIAETREAARDAVELIAFDIAEEPLATRRVLRHRWQSGVPQTGHEISVQLDHALVAPMALEPRATLAQPEGAGLRVHLSTQTPQRCRTDLAAILGLAPSAIRVLTQDVGGAFGGKASLMPEDAVVALAALRLGRPVKWTAARSEEFQAATQGRGGETRAVLTLDHQGVPVALSAELRFPLGHWMPYSALAPIRNAGRILPGPYAIEAVDIEAQAHLTPGAAVNIYRGAGRPEAAMLMERLIDKAAQAQGLDPLEMRRRALYRGAFPRATPTGEAICSGDFAALLDRLEREADYAGLRARQAERRAKGAVCGLGLALYIEPCGQGWESAELRLEADGSFTALTGSSAQGQGRETAFAQIVAEVMGVPPDSVRVVQGDTGAVPEGIGALASRSTAIGGTAMARAARRLLDQLGPRQDWAGIGPVSVKERYEAPGEAWASGAVLAEVAICPDTGHLTVEGITWVDDAGRVLNPMLVQGQLIGGLAQGLGAATMERMAYADGQLLTGSLMDYAVPRASDMPPVRLISQPLPSTANEMGFKGVGEAGCIGVPAALLNAVQDALLPFDAPDLSLPLTPEKLWRAMTGLEP